MLRWLMGSMTTSRTLGRIRGCICMKRRPDAGLNADGAEDANGTFQVLLVGLVTRVL